MWIFRTGSPRQIAAGIALLRLITGVVFIAHGAQKLFTMGLAAITEGFTQMGVPLPGVTAPMITLLELGGGLLLVVGLLTRPAALLLACDMAGAVLLVHLKSGFFLPAGYEFALLLGVAMIALVLTGAGAYSLDAMIARDGLPQGRPAEEPGAPPTPARPAPPAVTEPKPRWASRSTRPERGRPTPKS
jgi:putative oxidoreductase